MLALSLPLPLYCGLLGAGTGQGSCSAPPFRSSLVQWAGGCPVFAPCCSEYGYCHARADWAAGLFRDCNTLSNGQPLPLGVLQREYLESRHSNFPILGVSDIDISMARLQLINIVSRAQYRQNVFLLRKKIKSFKFMEKRPNLV